MGFWGESQLLYHTIQKCKIKYVKDVGTNKFKLKKILIVYNVRKKIRVELLVKQFENPTWKARESLKFYFICFI